MNKLLEFIGPALAQPVLQWINAPPPRPSPVANQLRRLSFSREVLRWSDLLSLRLDFYNLQLDADGARLQPVDPAADAFIAVTFDGQHLAEEAFTEGPNTSLPSPPVQARMAGESRLVFHVDAGEIPLPWSLEAVLALLSRSAPLVSDRKTAPVASPQPGQQARFGPDPRALTTLIEFPWRLMLSPHPDARWAHRAHAEPQDGGAWVDELWHTRLVRAAADGDPSGEEMDPVRSVRAVHARADGPQADPFLVSVKDVERPQLVELSGNRQRAGNAEVAVRHLMLSALGANAHLHGNWQVQGINIIDWLHQSWLGRDHFVRITKQGRLMPPGHRAAEITFTERKLGSADGVPAAAVEHPGRGQGRAAYLRQRKIIVVCERERTYAGAETPFRSLRLDTLVTPDLDTNELLWQDAPAPTSERSYWIRAQPSAAGATPPDVLFDITGIDWAGRACTFRMPLAFVFEAELDDAATLDTLIERYNAAGTDRRQRSLDGQMLAFAPFRNAGETTLECRSLRFSALKSSVVAPAPGNGLLGQFLRLQTQPTFLPGMALAKVVVPAIADLTGGTGLGDIRFEKSYLDGIRRRAGQAISGGAPRFDGAIDNAAEVYARLQPQRAVTFTPLDSGGLAAPDFSPDGLSRVLGPVADVGGLLGLDANDIPAVRGEFSPAKVLEQIKILGGVSLAAIFKPFPLDNLAQAGAHVPGLTQRRTTRHGSDGIQHGIETHYLWTVTKPFIQQEMLDTNPPSPGSFNPAAACRFSLDSVVFTPLDGGDPELTCTGTLDDFLVTLPPGKGAVIEAGFRQIRFTAGSGRKMDVSVDFTGLKFVGPLSFIETLREYIPIDGFIDPPYVDVGDEAVEAGYSLAIPSVGVGIFMMANLSLGAAFRLPYVGGAAGLRFAFCERHQPFMLTVSAIGGGGYAALELELGRVVNIELSLEFGAAVSVNLGVASGHVSVMGGTYMRMGQDGFLLEGYFRLNGSMSVLGLVSISIQILISLLFRAKVGNGRSSLVGEASVEVKVQLLCFSKKVRVAMRREFLGSDPDFAATVPLAHWNAYCLAFDDD